MSEEETATSEETREPLRPAPVTEDWALEELVRLANYADDDFELPITLMASGGVVTGSLIGIRRYFREYGLFWRTEEAPEVEAMWVERGEKAADAIKAEGQVHFDFIHLRSAQFAGGMGGLYPRNSTFLWRGRISHVTGFALGALTASKATLSATAQIVPPSDTES